MTVFELGYFNERNVTHRNNLEGMVIQAVLVKQDCTREENLFLSSCYHYEMRRASDWRKILLELEQRFRRIYLKQLKCLKTRIKAANNVVIESHTAQFNVLSSELKYMYNLSPR